MGVGDRRRHDQPRNLLAHKLDAAFGSCPPLVPAGRQRPPLPCQRPMRLLDDTDRNARNPTAQRGAARRQKVVRHQNGPASKASHVRAPRQQVRGTSSSRLFVSRRLTGTSRPWGRERSRPRSDVSRGPLYGRHRDSCPVTGLAASGRAAILSAPRKQPWHHVLSDRRCQTSHRLDVTACKFYKADEPVCA
jgi:hypothetical protein